jgi:ABC-type polysaccharide/polyol phosphate transport system ATPase subunit
MMIELTHLNKTYRVKESGVGVWGRHKEIKALEHVNLSIEKGSFVGLIGKNGSGKSTLMKIILGAVDPDPGSHVNCGGSVLRLALGMNFDEHLSGIENIMLNGMIMGIEERKLKNNIPAMLEFSGLSEFGNTLVKYYSTGMKTRLSIAIALEADADILLIDESFAEVGDSNFREKAHQALMEKARKGKTVIHATHSIELIRKYCPQVIYMENGAATLFNDSSEAIRAYEKT